MTFNVMFFIVAALILFFIWKGYNRGLIGIIFGILAWVFVIYFIQAATPVIEQYLYENEKVVETVGTKVEESLNEKADEVEESADESIEASEPLEKMKELLSKNDKLLELENQTEELFEEKKTEVISDSALVITGYIIHAIATIAAIVMACIIVSLAWTIVNFLNHAPILGKVSRFLGMLFGICEGFLIVWVLMYIISLIPATTLGQLAQSQINENEFLLYLYDNNILRSFLS